MAAEAKNGAPPTQPTPIERKYDVALNLEGGSDHNTLVIGGLDLIVPLEEDLDKDPENPDEIRLKSDDGSYEAHVRSTDEGVERSGNDPLLLYPFRDVPPGIYTLAVKVHEEWTNVLARFRVTRDGAFWGETSLEAAANGSDLGKPEPEYPDPDPAEDEPLVIEHECQA